MKTPIFETSWGSETSSVPFEEEKIIFSAFRHPSIPARLPAEPVTLGDFLCHQTTRGSDVCLDITWHGHSCYLIYRIDFWGQKRLLWSSSLTVLWSIVMFWAPASSLQGSGRTFPPTVHNQRVFAGLGLWVCSSLLVFFWRHLRLVGAGDGACQGPVVVCRNRFLCGGDVFS